MFFFLRGCYNRHEVKGIVEDYLNSKYYKGVTFKVGTPTKGLFAIMGPSNYSAPVTAIMEGREIPFLVKLDEHWDVRYEDFVERKFKIDVQDYIEEIIRPILEDTKVGVGGVGGGLAGKEPLEGYYLSSLEKVFSKLNTLNLSVSWNGKAELSKEQFYHICKQVGILLKQEQFSVSSVDFGYSTSKSVISINFQLSEDLEAAPERVIKKISVLNKSSNSTQAVTPVQISDLSGVLAIEAGVGHILAVKSDGTVWAWGNTFYGQSGPRTGDTVQWSKTPIAGATQVTAVGAGDNHSLSVKSDGSIWSWGSNVYGQLGDGTTTNRSAAVAMQKNTAPVY
jgi:hypothetical protein